MAIKTEVPKTAFQNWDWHTKHVEDRLKDGEYVSAETVLVAAGPPRFRQVAFGTQGAGQGTNVDQTGAGGEGAVEAGAVYPVGLVENFGLSQNKQLQRLFEIGSKRSYFVPGRTIGSLSIGRVLFWGPSILRVLYAYYPKSKIFLANGATGDDPSNDDGIGLTARNLDNVPNIINAPGSVVGSDPARKATFYSNLASDLFNQPLGLLVYMKDIRDQIYSGFYLENVYVQAHQLNINASSVLIAEGISAQYDQLLPVDISGA